MKSFMRRWRSEQDTEFIANHHCSLPRTMSKKGIAIKFNLGDNYLGKEWENVFNAS